MTEREEAHMGPKEMDEAATELDKTMQALSAVMEDVKVRQKAGERPPIENGVPCPVCNEGNIQYWYQGPRRMIASCTTHECVSWRS